MEEPEPTGAEEGGEGVLQREPEQQTLAAETASLNFPLIAKSCWFCSVRRKKLPFFFHIVVRQSFILISSSVESFVANLFYS